MRLKSEQNPDNSVIYLQGDIGETSSLQVDNEINKVYKISVKYLCVDLTQTYYIISSGVSVFVSHLQELRKNKTNLTLFGLKPKLEAVFAVLGIYHFLLMHLSL